jgi:acyl-CoA synthetase (AMP-forming)/AMP-acid ligase II
MPLHTLSQRITDVLALDPGANAIQYDGRWTTWQRLATAVGEIGALIDRYGGSAQPRIGILLRNQPAHVAALLGVLARGGTVVVLNPSRGDTRTRNEIAGLDLPVVIGLPDDLANVGMSSPTTTLVAITDVRRPPTVVSAASSQGPGAERPGVAVWMLTSGTTGPPKRVDLTYEMLARSVMSQHPPERIRAGVAIVNSPLVHIGGVFRVLLCLAQARPFVLLPKFELDRWAAAVREHRPRAVSLVPAALRMVLHSDLTAADLEGLEVVTSGTAPLSADDADAFTARFGIPVLTSYAATEFGGGVAGWTLADHRTFWQRKRGSVGRANPGAQLRVVDEAGTPLPVGRAGLLEVKPAQLGPDTDWIRTTDLARLDAEGFLWILGRADQAIIRGGFKVMPDDVRTALEAHPAVCGAAVVGRTDARLGAVPVAMVELRAASRADDLAGYLTDRLAPYEVPVQIEIVDAIPRTASGKPDLSAVREHFGA